MKIFRLVLLGYFLIMVMVYLGGCSPVDAYKVHRQIKAGMPVSDVLDILSKNKGRHLYYLLLYDRQDQAVRQHYRLDDFIRITNGQMTIGSNYSRYEALITVLFIGPGFLKNSFDIEFDYENKARLITPVRHWD